MGAAFSACRGLTAVAALGIVLVLILVIGLVVGLILILVLVIHGGSSISFLAEIPQW